MTNFAIRSEVLKAALEDYETRELLNVADTWSEMERILVEFARKKGYRVVELKP